MDQIAGFLPLLLIGLVFYFLIIRPQRARQQRQVQLVSSLAVGDRIVTIGGLHGTIQEVDEDTIRVEIAPGTVATLVKGAVARTLTDTDTDSDLEIDIDDDTDGFGPGPKR